MEKVNYFLNKISNHEQLDNEDIYELLWDYKIETIEGESHRWQREITTIVKLGDRYFAIPWKRGLTERQEDDIENSYPYEVEPYEETIIVTKWRPKICE